MTKVNTCELSDSSPTMPSAPRDERASELSAFAIQLIGASAKPFMTVADQLGLGSPGTASRRSERPRRYFSGIIPAFLQSRPILSVPYQKSDWIVENSKPKRCRYRL